MWFPPIFAYRIGLGAPSPMERKPATAPVARSYLFQMYAR